MSQIQADQGAPRSDASLVKGDGDNSFTLIWSRRNSDRSDRITARSSEAGFTALTTTRPLGFKRQKKP